MNTETTPEVAPETPQGNADTQETPTGMDGQQPIDLYKLLENKDFQSQLDKYVSKATETAAKNGAEKERQRIEKQYQKERERQEQLQKANMSREQKLALYKDDPEGLAKFYRDEAEEKAKALQELENKFARNEEIANLKIEVSDILIKSKVPIELFEHGLDYYALSSDQVRDRAIAFTQYEYFPVGEFEKAVIAKVEEGVKERLKEVTPEVSPTKPNLPNTPLQELEKQYIEALKGKDNALKIHLAQQLAKAKEQNNK